MNTLIGYDLVPEAKIIDSALRACRRLNDLASAIRILEAVKVRLRRVHLEGDAAVQKGPVLLGKSPFICRINLDPTKTSIPT